MAAKVLRVGPGGRGRYPTILAALAASGTDDTVISVAPGDYPQALVLGSNVEIRAEAGRGTVHLRPSGGGTPVEVRSGTVTLRGLVLHGTRADGVALAVGGGTVLVQECDVDSTGEGIGVTGGRVTVTGCTVRATGYGIGFLNAGGLVERCAIGPVGTSCVVVQGGAPVLRDCVLTTAGGNGLYLHTGSTGSYDDCEITGTTLAAVALNSAANPTVNRANIHHVAQGISVEGAFGVFADCTVRDTAGTLPAVRVAGGGAPRFTRLGIHDPAYQAVLVEGNSTPQFDDCTLTGSGSSAFAAMSGARPTVRRAGIRAAQGNGIYVDAASGVFEDCEVTGCALPGVALTNGADPTLRRVRVHRAANLAVLVKAAQGRFEDCVVEHTDANRNAVAVEEKSAPRFDGLTLTGVGGTAVVVRSASTPAMRRVTVGPGALAALVVDAAGGEYTGWSVGALPGHVTAAVGLRNAVEGTRLRDFRLSEVEAGVVVRGGHAGVSGLRVDQARRYGLRTDDGATVLVRDCELTGCAEWGVRLGPGDTRLHGVRVTGCGNGVEVGTGATARLDGCVVTGNRGLGVRVLSTGEVVLAGCTVDENALRDVAVEPGAHPRVEPASGAPGQPAVAPDAAGRDPAPGTTEPGTTEPGSGIAAPAGASPQLGAALAGLDALIGLGRVKEEIARLIDFARMQQRRRAVGLPDSSFTRHLVFAGPPGTGKTEVARAYARIAAALGLIPRDHVEEVDRAGLVGHHLGETERLTAAAFERARGGVLFVDEAYALAPNDEGRDLFGQAAIDTLVKRMEDAREDVIVIIAGYPSEMERLLDANPGLRSRFTTTIHFPNYTTAELVAIFEKFARDEAYRLTGGARAELTAFFGRLPRGRDFGNARTARVLFQAARDQLARRLAPVADPDADALSTLLPADITAAVAASGLGHGQGVPDTAQVARLLDQLDGMIGLTPVKREIRELVAQQENARRRVAEGLPVEQHPRHLLFVGPPGTGKTEVARLYGRLLAALGVLSQGEFVEAARSDLVAGWVGQTALKTAAAFTRARGGVLFIDEAYSLAPHHGPGNDFGAEALDTLVKLMEDRRDEVVVIAAGYPDEMDRLLSANSGLRSRFGRRVEFPAYSVDELVAIFERMVGARGYLATPETVAAVRTHLAGIERDRTFGNGRYVRQLLDSMLARQAVRLQATPSADRAALSTLLPEDLGTA